MPGDLYDDPPCSEDYEGLDPEGPSQADLERFGDELCNCPECGGDVYDQTPICPKCGHVFEDKPGFPAWIVLTAVVVLAGLVLTYVF